MVKLWLTKGKLRGNQLGASQPSQESEMHASRSAPIWWLLHVVGLGKVSREGLGAA